MAARVELKKYYDEKEVQVELQQIIAQINTLDTGASEVITTYCLQWFQSYFDSQCDENDFLSEIKKLEEPECEQQFMDFIKRKISFWENKAKKAKEENNTTVKTSTIHDRIKPKANNPNVNNPPANANSTPVNSQDKTVCPKKQVKILQKDEQKLKKASDAIENQNNSANEDDSLVKELEDKKKQRCKYYPSCKNERTCPYIHPTEPCTFFPTCKYGSQCINKHPDCKFGKSCQRPDCFYEHPFPKKPNMNPFLQMLMMPMMGSSKKRMIGKPNGKRPYLGNNNNNNNNNNSNSNNSTPQQAGGEEVKAEEKQQS